MIRRSQMSSACNNLKWPRPKKRKCSGFRRKKRSRFPSMSSKGRNSKKHALSMRRLWKPVRRSSMTSRK
jgi:hypothetical protein